MTPNRFYNRPPDQPPRDGEIIERATALKIDLYRDKDGDLHGDVEIRCGIGAFAEKDYGEYETERFRQDQADAMRFVRKLLGEFEKKGSEADPC